MLGKLLKHEWKSVWGVPTLLIGILMIIAILAGLTFVLPIWESEWVGLPLSGVMLFVTFYLAMIAVMLGISIYFAVRFYKNMFTDEGYLTHTLPVTPRQLLLNKVITMSAWNLIGELAIIASLFVFGGITMLSMMSKDSTFARELMEGISAWRELMESPYMDGFEWFCISILCMILVGAFSGSMQIIGSITLGQMVRRHRVLGAIGIYFGLAIALQIVNTAFVMPVMMKMMESSFDGRYSNQQTPFPVLTPVYLIMTCVSLAVGIGLYFMSEYLLRRQLELE